MTGRWTDAVCQICPAPARVYACGPRCADHAPRPVNPEPDPARTLDGLLATAGLHHRSPGASEGWAAIDARHIASGKRRASPALYRAARDTVAEHRSHK